MTAINIPLSVSNRGWELISCSRAVKIIDEYVFNPQKGRRGGRGRRREEGREGVVAVEGEGGGDGGGMGGGKGADFSLVASGLRQFGFQPRLQSRSRATQKNQNRKGVGNQCAKGRTEAPPPPTPSARSQPPPSPSPLLVSPGFRY